MGRDKNSSAKTPNGFTVGIDSTRRSFSERSRTCAARSGIGSVKNLRSARRASDPIARAIFVLTLIGRSRDNKLERAERNERLSCRARE